MTHCNKVFHINHRHVNILQNKFTATKQFNTLTAFLQIKFPLDIKNIKTPQDKLATSKQHSPISDSCHCIYGRKAFKCE